MWGEADPMCRIVHHHCPHFWCLILNGRVSVVDDHWLKLSLVLPNPFVALTTGRVCIAASLKLFGTTLHIRNLSALNKTLKSTKLSRCNNCVELNSTARKNAIELYRRSKEILPQQSMIMPF
ncbi:hypothetical protein P8452_29121 [Trifolium repens]|nr:hypothetical protein P8452_29121 [Trifolium repens]